MIGFGLPLTGQINVIDLPILVCTNVSLSVSIIQGGTLKKGITRNLLFFEQYVYY